MRHVAVISCSASKYEGTMTVKELYSRSTWFRALLVFTTQRFRTILVLSARYGLVQLTDIIESYDFSVLHRDPRISKVAAQLLPAWGALVGQQFRRMFPPPYEQYAVFLYVGKSYAEHIVANLPPEVTTYRPFQHLGQGAQVHYCLRMSRRPLPPQRKAVWVYYDQDRTLRARLVTFRVDDKNFVYSDDLEEVLRVPKSELFLPTEDAFEIERLYEKISATRQRQWELLDRLQPYYS